MLLCPCHQQTSSAIHKDARLLVAGHSMILPGIITACKEDGTRLCFYTCWDTQLPPPPGTRGRHPPPDQRPAAPLDQRQAPPPRSRPPPAQCMLGDTGNKQAVCILLECNLVSLHIHSMWETICDAWAYWSGWNFGPNSDRIPPILKFRIPPKMKIVRESKSKSFRIPPPNENCQRVQIREFQNTPKWKLSESKSESFRIPTQMKIVRESKSKSFRIPPPNENCQRVQIWEFQNTPKWKLSESKSESFRIPTQMKIVRESKSKSFRIPPPPNENCQRVQIQGFQNTPPPQNRKNFRFQTLE